jgi:ribokinase
MAMSARVFVFGSINTDLVVYVEQLPHPGETVSGGTYASYPGGKGANQAVAAARAGAEVEMFGCLGDDLLGRARLASLAETGISTRCVRILANAASGVAQITVDSDGENTIAVAPGANMLFSAEGIDLPQPSSGETWVSLFQNEIPQDAAEKLIVRAHAARHVVLWNLAPTLARQPSQESLRALDFLICNRNELAALTGVTDEVEGSARMPLGWGVQNLIVTLGREGSLLVRKDARQEIAVLRVPAFSVNAVDTVGAGDCFCGVLAASLAQGRPIEEALKRASAAAAISTTRRGAQTSMPMAEEIQDFLARQAGRS